MKKFVLFLVVVFLSVEVGVAQGVLDEDEKAAVLDSLRYYPITGDDHFKYNIFNPNVVGSGFDIDSKGNIIFYIFEYDYYPIEYKVSIDSVSGTINRELYNNYNETSFYQLSAGSWIYDHWYYLNDNLYSYRKVTDSIYVKFDEFHIVEQLYFSLPPAIGDTVIRGSSQFGVEIADWDDREKTYTIENGDGIPYTIYRGYMEKTDRELEFENPQDTIIQMIQFQNDELIYTLAKDIGLIHIDRIVPNGEEEIIERILELSTATIGDREMKRPKYVVVSTEEEPQAPT